MTIIFALLLIVLGLLAAQEFIGGKVPALKSVIDPLAASGEFIGIGGLLCGFIWFLQATRLLAVIDIHPIMVVAGFISSMLAMVLGLVFGLPLLHKFMNEPTPSFLLKADKWSESLKPKSKELGLIAIVLGVVGILCGV